MCGGAQLEYDETIADGFVNGQSDPICVPGATDGGTVGSIGLTISSATMGTNGIYTVHGTLNATLAQADCGQEGCPSPGGSVAVSLTF
jgi:hypothetical protein